MAKEKRTDDQQQVAFTIEVKDCWKALVLQIATYVCAQFAVSPLRCFVPGIGVNHKMGTISFFILLFGGLTMSSPIPIRFMNTRMKHRKHEKVEEFEIRRNDAIEKNMVLVANNQKMVLKLMLSILLWQTPIDAGFPTFHEWANDLTTASDRSNPLFRGCA